MICRVMHDLPCIGIVYFDFMQFKIAVHRHHADIHFAGKFEMWDRFRRICIDNRLGRYSKVHDFCDFSLRCAVEASAEIGKSLNYDRAIITLNSCMSKKKFALRFNKINAKKNKTKQKIVFHMPIGWVILKIDIDSVTSIEFEAIRMIARVITIVAKSLSTFNRNNNVTISTDCMIHSSIIWLQSKSRSVSGWGTQKIFQLKLNIVVRLQFVHWNHFW